MKIKFFSLVLAFFFLFLGEKAGAQDKAPTNVEEPTLKQKIEDKLKSMSVEQKIGQMFILGFSSTAFDKKYQKLLSSYQPGGLIVFGRNITSHQQIASLNFKTQSFLKKKVGVPALIMVDQEGGSVTRIKTRPSAPSALALGMTQNSELIEKAGRISGKMLKLLGFNMNLAPVLDLSPPEKHNFIGNRSFGGDPEKVKTMAQAFADGLKSADIIPTAKHFPGHGGITQDSHHSLPIKQESARQLYTRDLVPFRHFIQQSYPSAIMIAHVAFPKIDPSGVPAAFSSIMINNLLRDRLGYNGLVITDDIEMAGADSVGDIGERAVQALEAGCDMIMVAWSPVRQRKAFNAVKKAVQSGRLSMDRIDDSVRRIVHAKLLLKEDEPEVPSKKQIFTNMKTLISELKLLTHNVSLSNFKKSAEAYPHLKGSLAKSQPVSIFSADGNFLRSFSRQKKGRVSFYPLSPKKADPVKGSLKRQPKALPIYYVTGEGTARRLRNLDSKIKKRLVVVNSTHPGLIGDNEDFYAVFDIHSRDYKAGEWISDFLFEGDLRLPSSD